MPESLYDILGVPRTASEEEIRQRFRALGLTQHPDVHPDKSASHERFVRIVEAYQVLRDPTLRSAYDGSLPPVFEPPSSEVAPVDAVTLGDAVEVDFGGEVLACHIAAMMGGLLHLSAGIGAVRALSASRRSRGIDGMLAHLHVQRGGRSLESVTAMREWIWTRPPILVVGPVTHWLESQRRQAQRLPRELQARLTVGTAEWWGRTVDVSEEGVSLRSAVGSSPREGASGWLAVAPVGSAVGWWQPGCEALPIRVARVRSRLGNGGRMREIGARLEGASPTQTEAWRQLLAQLQPSKPI